MPKVRSVVSEPDRPHISSDTRISKSPSNSPTPDRRRRPSSETATSCWPPRVVADSKSEVPSRFCVRDSQALILRISKESDPVNSLSVATLFEGDPGDRDRYVPGPRAGHLAELRLAELEPPNGAPDHAAERLAALRVRRRWTNR